MSFSLTVLFLFAALIARPGVSQQVRTSQPLSANPVAQDDDRTASLRASFGKASHVLTGTVMDMAVYRRSGEKLAEIPKTLGRRQYLVIDLHVGRTLISASKLPANITLRLEAPGLEVAPFIASLIGSDKIFFLKRDFNARDADYFYPSDQVIFFADKSYVPEIERWAKRRIEKTASPPQSARNFYGVPGSVPHVLQEGSFDCWAAAAAMMLSWRDQTEYTKEEVARRAGPAFVQLLAAKSNGGIDATSKREFLTRLGLVAEAPQTFTPRGLRELLQEHGPLWVTVNDGEEDDDPDFLVPHARLIIAIEGGGSPKDTFVTYLDPNGFAERQRVNVQDFTQTFEAVAKSDLAKARELEKQPAQPFRPQILHF
jgi:hypothetical protein